MARLIPLAAALLVVLTAALASAERLSVRGNKLVNERGQPVKLHGINWFGFNNAQTMVDGLWAGDSSLTKDFSTQLYRIQLLGFNALRLPFSFKDFALPGRTDYNQCRQASLDEVRRSVTPPGVNAGGRPLPQPRAPLTAGGGRCNIGMPNNVFDRFLWAVNLAARAGMVVVIDNHVWLEDPTAYENPKLWVDSWAKLAAAVARDPVSRGIVLFDLVNEPDNKKIFWKPRGGRPGLAQLYLDAMDAITRAHRDAIFVLEGTGQVAYAIPAGDGFVTDPAIIKSFANRKQCTTRYCTTGIEDPNFFFQALLAKPYAQQVVWGPHFYGQSVIPYDLPKEYMQPPGLFKRLSDSFGYLTTKGYCSGGKCLKWPVLIGEFSAPHAKAQQDVPSTNGLVDYMNNVGAARDGRHEAIDMWFFWCFNDNSPDTNGGIVKSNWADIDWDKVNFLRRLGLKPWYA